MEARHGRTEATVLAFQRERVFEGVHIAQVGLRTAENSTFHSHTVTRDTFFVMAGRLTIEIHLRTGDSSLQYHLLKVGSADGSNDARMSERGSVQRIVLSPGDVCVIEPGVVHFAMNLDPEPCHFLCIEGIGEYDFKEVGS
jgi:quercetin dioxygenase-like cupin family protein